MDIFNNGATFTVTVADTSVGIPAANLQPTTGALQGFNMEIATIYAVGALYVETGGGAATTAGFPMAAGDSLQLTGYENLTKVRFIRNTTSTSIVVIPSYR